MYPRIAVALLLIPFFALAQKPAPQTFQPAQGERIALVGGSFGDVLGQEGTFEALLHSRFAKSELVVRNFCRPADEVGVRQRPGSYTAIDDPLKVFGPDGFVCFFGGNESFAGAAGVEKFQADYPEFADSTCVLTIFGLWWRASR